MVPTAAGEAHAVKIFQHVDGGVSPDGGRIPKGPSVKALRGFGGQGAKGLFQGGKALGQQESVLGHLE